MRARNVEASRAQEATRREFMVEATMISGLIVNSRFHRGRSFRQAQDTVALEIGTETGELAHQELPTAIAPLLESADRISTVARLAAAARLKESNEAAGLRTLSSIDC
jgi:hypothetical protein